MSIIKAIQNGVSAAFVALKEFQTNAIFKQYYRDASHNRILRTQPIIGILTDYSEFERQRQNIPFSTKKIICESYYFDALTPNIADVFEIDEHDWRVESFDLDPTGIVYTFQISR